MPQRSMVHVPESLCRRLKAMLHHWWWKRNNGYWEQMEKHADLAGVHKCQDFTTVRAAWGHGVGDSHGSVSPSAPQLGTLPSRSRAGGGHKELWALSISLGTRTCQDQVRSSVCRSLSGSGLVKGTRVRHGPKMARHGPHPCSAVWGFCP